MRTKLPGSLAEFLVAASTRKAPLKTVRQLAAVCGISVRTLQARSKDAGVSAKQCLDFVRCLRVVQSDREPWDPSALLSPDAADARTVKRLVAQGALDRTKRPSVSDFINTQRFLKPARLKDEILRELKKR